MADLVQLKRRRGQIKASLTRCKSYYDSVDKEHLDNKIYYELKIRLDKLNPLLDNFNVVQEGIDELHDNIAEQAAEREEFETEYYTLCANIEETMQQCSLNRNRKLDDMSQINSDIEFDNNTPNACVHNNTSAQPFNFNPVQVQLPIIQLPTFNGEYTKWVEFRDRFEALVGNSTILSDVQKMHHLFSCLNKEALETVKSIPISGCNYSVAWRALKVRYEKSQLIISTHVQGILNYPNITKESSKDLRNFYNTINNNLEALRSLGEPVDQWNTLLINILVDKVDNATKREWEHHCAKQSAIDVSENKNPTINDLFTLLQVRCDVLEKLELRKSLAINKQEKLKFESKTKPHSTAYATVNTVNCFYCKKNHTIYKCDKFLSLSPTDRSEEARKLQLCLNCLRINHATSKCKSSTCRKCKGPHNTLLHVDFLSNSSQEETTNTNAVSNTIISKSSTNHTVDQICNVVTSQTLLATVVVLVEDIRGELHRCRALLDNGSMSNFVSEKLCKKLNINTKRVHFSVSGVGQTVSDVQNSANFTIHSRDRVYTQSISCLVLPEITANLPLVTFDKTILQLPDNIHLADPTFHETGQIDLLLGSSIFWNVLRTEQRQLSNHLSLQDTAFGYIVVGTMSTTYHNFKSSSYCSTTRLEQQVAKFWEVEEVNTKISLSDSEEYCEQYFRDTITRNVEGRFVVSIPFKEQYKELGHSRDFALARFNSQEQRLAKRPNVYKEYVKFMREYISLGHMVEVTENDMREELNYYVPHHPVIKESSSTTKLRVVFDASMKTDCGLSLNDVQHVGPTIQNDLLSLILRFRMYKYVMTADIAKMYRMILVKPEHCRFQRILWRENPSDDLKCYELKTVTYGTASAPYLAIRCLHELALENSKSKPAASEAIKQNFYVDDFLYGSDSKCELVQIQKDVSTILASAGLQLRKWIVNNIELYREFELNADVDNSIVNLGEDEANKTLGICWNPTVDTIEYSVKFMSNSTSHRVTKRLILSEISQIFDPLGLLGPIIITSKLLMQALWQAKVSWDNQIPEILENQWSKFRESLQEITGLRIPRYVTLHNSVYRELHGFGDASERAYGACVYIRSISTKGIQSQLLCAKSKVAPIKQLSLPRLELCSALLVAQLVDRVRKSLNVGFDKEYFWSDSTITLSWIRASANRWKTFVANRVSEIQQLTKVEDWNHVISQDNPADLISRGMPVQQLKESTLWWSGPPWLMYHTLPLSKGNTENDDKVELEERLVAYTAVNNNLNLIIFGKFSRLTKLQRVFAYCLRFIKNCKLRRESRCAMTLSVNELQESLNSLICLAQRDAFPLEYKCLSKGKEISSKSNLLCLNPYFEDGLIRVGGRLQNSACNFGRKHPVVLPKGHKLTSLIFNHEHQRLGHCGPTMLLSSIRERYWPISGRNGAKFTVRNCIVCFRVKPRSVDYLMGNLPESRVNKYTPFFNTGIDYAGPFMLKDRSTRNAKLIKGYICLFICLATKAVHLEAVSDLTTQGFLATLKRFISRRGKPLNIYSDNGKNFVGADVEIKRFLQIQNSNIYDFLAKDKITWHFIPARSPSFGGIWEAGIKSVKHHLRRVVGNAHLNFEEFATVLTQIESILNSRPLCPLSSDPDNLDPLTPGHFLIGKSLVSLPEPEYTKTPENRLKRYQRLQQMVQNFWSRWYKEYLSELQTRVKWKKNSKCSLAVGSIVLLKDENLPPMRWRLGRILELHPGSDGVVRVVRLKVLDGIVDRSVNKICPLPDATDND